ncbi:2Fe-2S iron-sulfur cluster-binding protein [Pseudomonas sp. GD03860]|uniref:2Fe-2S iron-sulfur cluster-binding protein n=1 Tax=Pseudomonas TaxID=286 RepID=UPI0023642F50|nr:MULTISPECIES: 2Fe-2S iron-sulfur cluster-binding protein [Pseudomonas]MDD2056904.1 2Fe-2S iron-sulfur cluster-binding protein [Pseudomonas putida]MDH0637896.1 2Fe-2S iron-sulfur cluster-binding protein [Pseudomonas sp. GD03860]
MKQIEIRQAGRTIVVPDGMTILEAALADGIAYPHGCRSGRCGSCKSRLISGEVELLEHSRFALSQEEKCLGLVLACRALPRTDAIVAWLGGDEQLPVHPRRQLNCRVKAIDNATHDIKRIQLDIGEAEPLAFTAGQYAQLTFPGAPGRDYSMANRPGERVLEFHIRRVPDGATTGRVHQLLQPGDPVALEGPFGSACLREQHTGPILCIAGGSGLAPIKAIVEAAVAQGMKQPIHVYFGARSERDLYLVEHFQALARQYANLRFIPVLSDVAVTGHWRTGYVTDAIAHDLADLDGWKAYVAGPPLMVEAAMQITQARALRTEDLHADVFFTPAGENEET